jgi:hypothetical protein
VSVDGEEKARAERMRGSHQRAQIHRLGNLFSANAEKAAHYQKRGSRPVRRQF